MQTGKVTQLNFLAGGGEMGERILTFAWEKTSLGPIESWPQSLKTSIGLMLNSQHPIWIGWGPEAAFLYNDPYIGVLSSAKHPHALGEPAAKVWAEIWDFCGPLADKVFQKGEASYMNDVRLFMDRGEFLEEVFYSFSYSPIRDESGNVGGLFCPSTEVTAKALHTRRLRTLSELASESLAQKSISAACVAAAKILEKAREDVPFALLYLISPDGSVGLLEQAIGVSEENGVICPKTVGLKGSAKDGVPWPIAQVVNRLLPEVVPIKEVEGLPLGAADRKVNEAFVLPIVSRGDARPMGVLVAGVNPTRKLDSDYRSFFELVAGHVATAIQNARAAEEDKRRADMLAELDRAKTAFFSNVSHELRTPLTLILGPLEDGIRESTNPPEWLTLAHRNSLRLLKLVNTLLDFTRIEAGRVEASFEPTDLAVYTEELASVFRSGVERVGLRLLVDCKASAEPTYVDREMWEKIVFNLLSNALKFTEQGEIDVKLEETNDRRSVKLTVRDTGIGIPEKELPQVFERFRRLKSSWSRSHEGTGIGLALVQELVRLHGGEISVQSEIGRGTTFTVLIPLGTEHLPKERLATSRRADGKNLNASLFIEEASRWLPSDASEPEPLPVSELKSRDAIPNGRSNAPERVPGRILLADDNGDMRVYVQRLLASEGYDVIAVADGEAALASARASTPDLVLSDVMMPKLDGFGLLRELRNDSATTSIPIILLSARAGEESRVEGVEAGADDYLIKPFSARELLARVKTHLELARVRRDAQEKLTAAHDRLQTVLSSISDGLVVFDKNWRYTYVSEQAARIVGQRADEMLGECVWDLFPKAKGTKFYESHYQAVETGKMVQIEEYYPEPMNKWLECHCYPSDVGLSVYFHDITERKKAEEALASAHAQLADKATHLEALVQQRTAKLTETIGDLEAFSYSIAHDMRAPLRSLQGFSRILLSDYGDKLDGEGQGFLKRIATSAGRMDKLIQDVLSYSRVVRNESPIEKIEVANLLQGIIDTYPALSSETATIDLEDSFPPVWGNEAMLTQVFSNILGNAVKFVAPGVKPQIKVWAEPKESNVRILVRDNGIGIARDQYEKIFEIFQQVETGFEGTGIGLAIVKKAVERMGGKVGVVSDVGQGSTFWIELKRFQGEEK
jgi:PAS domain S-box-containing protein